MKGITHEPSMWAGSSAHQCLSANTLPLPTVALRTPLHLTSLSSAGVLAPTLDHDLVRTNSINKMIVGLPFSCCHRVLNLTQTRKRQVAERLQRAQIRAFKKAEASTPPRPKSSAAAQGGPPSAGWRPSSLWTSQLCSVENLPLHRLALHTGDEMRFPGAFEQ